MFGHLLTAMVTPFDSSLQLDLERLPRLIDHLIATGTTGLVVCGTTGESPTLSHREKLLLIEETARLCAGRIPVIAGTGANDTAATVEFTREAEQLLVHKNAPSVPNRRISVYRGQFDYSAKRAAEFSSFLSCGLRQRQAHFADRYVKHLKSRLREYGTRCFKQTFKERHQAMMHPSRLCEVAFKKSLQHACHLISDDVRSHAYHAHCSQCQHRQRILVIPAVYIEVLRRFPDHS